MLSTKNNQKGLKTSPYILIAFMGAVFSFVFLFIENFFLKKYIFQISGRWANIFLFFYPVVSAFLFFIFYQKAISQNKVYILRKILFILFTLIVIVIADAITLKIVGRISEPQDLKIINGRAVTPNGTYFMRPPPCPIAATFAFPAFLLRGKMAYPTLPVFLVSVFLIWLIPILILGRTFCSWLCPFGGIDEFFSSLNKYFKKKYNTVAKQSIKFLNSLEKEWFNFRILFFLVLLSFGVILGKAVFCEWLCPLQSFYTPPALTAGKGILKAFILFGGAIIFLITLPLVTGKRIFCSYLCPVGGINGIAGYFNPFTIKKSFSLCNNCMLCEKDCPLQIKFNDKGEKGILNNACANCFKCIENCHSSALNIYLKKTNKIIPEFFVFIILLLSLNLIFFIASGGAFFTLVMLG